MYVHSTCISSRMNIKSSSVSLTNIWEKTDQKAGDSPCRVLLGMCFYAFVLGKHNLGFLGIFLKDIS